MRMAVTAATILALSACSASSPRACGAAGAASGVSFDTSSWSATAAPLTAHACVGNHCVDRALGQGQPRLIFVDDPSLSSDKPLVVTLTVMGSGSKTVFNASTTVRPQKFLPNGAGCPPTAWQSRVQPTDRGLVLVVK